MINLLRLQQLAKLLDVTRLQDDDNEQSFTQWLNTVPEMNVAAYCVYPQFLPLIQQWQQSRPATALATVVNFPSADLPSEKVCDQIQHAISAGAGEIDCVMPYKALLRGEQGNVKHFLYDVRQAAAGQCLKIIIESGELITAQQITKATELAIESGADFVKTSTGKVPVGVTDEAARIMLTVIAAAGRKVGFKASGGVKTLEQALRLVDMYESLTGNIATSQFMRIGASSLAIDVNMAIQAAR